MNSHVLFAVIFIVTSVSASVGKASKSSIDQPFRKKSQSKEIGEDTNKHTKQNVFLRVRSPMKNISATSRDTVQFKCRINGWPKKIQYTWYKDNLYIDMNEDPRVSIATRPWGSRLRIKDVFTVDTGFYRCEGSNGYRRVHSAAHLQVDFERPPPPSEKENEMLSFPEGKCEKYSGTICKDYLSGLDIYVDSFESQRDIKDRLQDSLQKFARASSITKNCQKYILPALCYFTYTPCHGTANSATQRGEQLCREDCEFLKSSVCNDIFKNLKPNSALQRLVGSANCSILSSQYSSNCVMLNLAAPRLSAGEEECFYGKGESYRGRVNTASSGGVCEPWPLHMAKEHPELLGGHNFCRNPGGVEDQPWCIVDIASSKKAICPIRKCEPKKDSNWQRIVLISCVGAGGIVVMTVCALLCCLRPRKRTKSRKAPKFDVSRDASRSDVVLLRQQNPSPIFIDPGSIHLVTEIGLGNFGKVYEGIISNDPRFFEKQSFAFKMFSNGDVSNKSFKREMEIFSNLSHLNIANLKGISLAADKSNILVFEHTNFQNLHEYLVLRSPDVEVSNPQPAGASELDENTKVNFDSLIKMSMQISSGMEYLASNNYIHRDLAARNVLVCGNMDMKISDLGVVKESFLFCYYKSPQGRLLPIRWMAPESLDCWQFSDKSTVWSFGVLLWEMFSYGSHPYCGYSNHEVLEMISRRQLLPCPDHCPAKIYSLMHECWNGQPMQRPNFRIIQNTLEAVHQGNHERENSHSQEKTFFVNNQNQQSLEITADWQACPKYSEKVSLLSENSPQTN